jgi:hypothetical protein
MGRGTFFLLKTGLFGPETAKQADFGLAFLPKIL